MLKTTLPKAKFSAAIAPLAAICALAAAAALGAGVVTAGAESIPKTIAFGAVAAVLLGAVGYFILELPFLVFVRFAFVCSFFFKGEINFFKINEVEDPSGLNLSLTLVTGLILLAYDFTFEENAQSLPAVPTGFACLLGGLLLCAVLAVIYNDAGWLGWFSLVSVLTSILSAYVIASHFARRERIGELAAAVALGLLFTGVIALSQYALDFPKNLSFFGTGTEDEMLGTQSVALSRVPAFLRTPTEMAWVVSALIPLVLAPLLCAVKNLQTRHQLFLAAAALAGGIAVVLSLARGSWFGLLAALGILIGGGWMQLAPAERRARAIPAAAAVLLAVIFLTPFAGRIYERLTADDEGSGAIRLPLLQVAERVIADNALVGVGLNNYRAKMTKYDETGIFVSQVFPNPVHNMFAHVTAEIGVPGGIIFCLLIVAAFWENWRTMRDSDRLLSALALAAFAGLAAFIISAMKEPGSLGSVRPPMRTLFFLFGVTLALGNLRRRQTLAS